MRTLLLAAAVLLLACSPEIPSIPHISAETFPANVQAKFRQALAALEKSPVDSEANARLGMLLHAHGQFDQALACYRRAAHFGPTDPRWPYLQGAVLAAKGDLPSAIEAWHTSLALAPAAPTLIHLGDALEALGRREESRKAFEDALQLDPEAAAALYGVARILSAQGNYAEAIPLLRKAVVLAPNAGAAHHALGVALRDTGQQQAARLSLGMAERFQRARPPVEDPILDEVHALRRDPNWLLEEGRRLETIGDIHQAAALFQEAVDQDPDFALAHAHLVSTLGLLGRYEDAEKHYRWALRVAPGLEELHFNWGIVQAERGAPEAAADSFRAALEINPASADSHFNLGSMLAELGLDADAVRELETAVELDPSHRLALFQLARRRIESGDLEEGIALLERTIDAPVDARTPGLLYALADAYARAGNNERAILHARQALDLALEFGDQQMVTALESDLRGLEALP